MNWDFVKICEDVKSKQGQLLSILTKIRYSHGQQSLLVGKCLRENHRQIKSCLPHLPANRKKSGDFAESRKQVTSSCFKWQKRPQYTRTQASPSLRGLLGSKWQTIKRCVKSFFVLWKYCFSVTSKQNLWLCVKIGNCIDGRLFKASLNFLQHFFNLCHNICPL